MKSSGKRMLHLLISIIIFVVAIFVYSKFVAPEYQRVNALRGEAQAKQQTLDEQRQIQEQVSSLLTKYQGIPQVGQVVSMALPNNEDVATAFQQVYTIASASNIVISQFSVNTGLSLASTKGQSVRSVRSIGTAQINLYLIGSYESFKSFVQVAERNMRIMDITNIKIQPVSRTSDATYLFNLTINAYYQS
jgi:Tfp pilus assembly protein PilO